MRREEIIAYLTEKYTPDVIIAYGSFADGTNGANSDFDALVITGAQCAGQHDTSQICETLLDVFIYAPEEFAGIDASRYVQLYGGRLVLDKTGLGAKLMTAVNEYVAARLLELRSPKAQKENITAVEWCEKMLLRTARNDAEGFYRWHWLLTDSLEIYSGISGIFYFGPKKTLIHMMQNDIKAYKIYLAALRTMDGGALMEWITLLRQRLG
ncbi:MAG TPA: nucleotidyltransferase domain-containing protein [Bacillota bacterium]|nr:nucleotidyltransferase domain-containing protein [Bacillota bacterium]